MDKTMNSNPKNLEKEIEQFKVDIKKTIYIFFSLKERYEHDDTGVLKKVEIFRKYLYEFCQKYPAVCVVLDEEDFTTDDLKILLEKYNSKQAIMEKFKLDTLPIMVKRCEKHHKLQVLLDYKKLDFKMNESLDFLAVLAIEDMDEGKTIKLPDELASICSEIGEKFSTASRGVLANKG